MANNTMKAPTPGAPVSARAPRTTTRRKPAPSPEPMPLSPPAESYFNPSTFRVLVELAHMRYCDEAPGAFVAEPFAIYVRARRWAESLRRIRPVDPLGRPLLTSRDVAHAAFAGLAVYSLDRHGLDYVQLCRRCDPGIADLVRAVSGDVRLDAGPRMFEMEARVGQAPELAQLARLAELYATGRALRETISSDPSWLLGKSADVVRSWSVREWAGHAARSTAAMNRLFPNAAAGPVEIRGKAERLWAWLFEAAESHRVRRLRG